MVIAAERALKFVARWSSLWTQRGPEDLERNRCDVTQGFPAWSVVLPSVAKVLIAAFSKVLLPLWLCVVFTAYMFGPTP